MKTGHVLITTRDKELKKHMAATRKTAEKNNETRTTSSFKGTPRESVRPQPGDTQHGGGGTYKEGSAPGANPADIQMGGGGSYVSGSSKKKAKASSATANTKAAAPRNNPFSKRSKPKPP